jgi:hypothetical protein
LHWVFRPKPRKDTIPRRANETEKLIESTFKSYLRHVVETSSESIVVKYTPARLIDTEKEVMQPPSAHIADEDNVKELEFRVPTPLFYSRFVHYFNTLDGHPSTTKVQRSFCLTPTSSLIFSSMINPNSPVCPTRWHHLVGTTSTSPYLLNIYAID